MKQLALLGRILFSSVFILASFHHFSQQAVDYAASRGVPFAQLFVPLSGMIALFGGLSVLFGYRARAGAWLLIVFLVPVTLMMHNFWTIKDVQEANLQRVMFMKNLSMLGGAFLIAYFGAGAVSIDARHDHYTERESIERRAA